MGLVVGANQVIYTNAFDGLNADIETTYTLDGFQQNIVLREQPPSPSNYGLNPATTFLNVITRFLKAPTPQITTIQTDGVNDDVLLDFGDMVMGQGTAFLTPVTGNGPQQVEVSKQWVPLTDGTVALTESVPYSAISNLLQTLPLHSSISKPGRNVRRTASLKSLLERQAARSTRLGQIRVAQAVPVRPGFVIDYTLLTGSLTNYIFQGDTTYYISGALTLYGTNTFEGGAVIKYTNGASIAASVGAQNANILFVNGPYRPIVFTAKDDNSVGDTITGSTGNPVNYYANPALNAGVVSLAITNVRISYASQAITINPGSTQSIVDSQFINCSNGVSVGDASQVTVKNTLFAYVYCPFNNIDGTGNTINGENLTCSIIQYIANIGSGGTNGLSVNFTNCLFSQVTNLANLTFSFNGNYNGFYSSPTFGGNIMSSSSYPFQTVGAGSFYLANGSGFRDAGTANVDGAILADLGQKTTYPPVLYPPSWFTTNYIFFPQAQRDTDTPDLGYHYYPLDYLVSIAISNAAATVLPGTAVGTYGVQYGIALYSTGTFNCRGTATSPNYLVRYNIVQEQALTNTDWETTTWAGSFMTPWQADTSTAQFAFTEWSALGGAGQIEGEGYACPVGIDNCQFFNGTIFGWGPTLSSTNTLYRRVNTTVSDRGLGSASNSFFNTLFLDGEVKIVHTESGTWTFRDNLFDTVPITLQSGSVIDVCSNNAYVTTNNGVLLPTNNEIILSNSPAYQTGALGVNYYPTNLSLIHAGSQSAPAAGLYHYTVTTNNAIEGTNIVSIGFHYVAVTNGLPIDSNGDGIPDYLEDANGNGLVDSGEIDWQVAGDLGLTVVITQPVNNSKVP